MLHTDAVIRSRVVANVSVKASDPKLSHQLHIYMDVDIHKHLSNTYPLHLEICDLNYYVGYNMKSCHA
jgi:hypothetical protein